MILQYTNFILLANSLIVASQVLIAMLLSACSFGSGDMSSAPPTEITNAAVFESFHQRSEQIYNGNGSWGQTTYGYKMALRDCYWRADVYGFLANTNPTYARRADEAIGYLLRAQSEGGTGVFGFPADGSNPEFGAKVRAVINACPTCVHNEWIISLPGKDVAELYYDHGYALTAIARSYQRTRNQTLLAPITLAADWILDKPLTANVNYLSALSKGLIYAYHVTNDRRYLDKAIQLHREGILPFFNSAGEAVDTHNARLEYHGFIVSGMIALRQSLPADHAFIAELDPILTLTVARMATRGLDSNGEYGVTWPGTNLLAWHELSFLRALNGKEVLARDRTLALIRGYMDDVKAEGDGFRLQKALYTYFFIGLFAK
jgi:hypothetical protein